MNSKTRSGILILGDYVLFHFAMILTVVFLRPSVDPRYLDHHLSVFPYIFALWLVVNYIEGLYSLSTTMLNSLALSMSRSIVLSVLGSFVIFYLIPESEITPRRNLLLIGFISFFLSYLWHQFLRKIISSNRFKIKTTVLGEMNAVNIILEDIKFKPFLGFDIIGSSHNLESLPLNESDLIVVDRTQLKSSSITNKLLTFIGRDVSIMELSRFSEIVSGKIPLSAIDSAWFLEVCGKPTSLGNRFIKNLIDKFSAMILFLLMCIIYLFLFPILLIISGRPLFFSQTRTGYLGRPFKIYKLRTMIVNAEKSGAQWATPGDNRITPIGQFLRKTRLDELPQLWNIIKGDMSLVGPRPERPEFIDTILAPKIPFYNQRHLVKPGVTGWAQVNYRYGYSADDSLEKLQYDLYYVKNQNIWLDIRILLRTFKTILTGAGQ
jgi:exopolysaccharide biosynthesis polyprenyl glycosylphosphotransferase